MALPTTEEELAEFVNERIEYWFENMGMTRDLETPGQPLVVSTRLLCQAGVDCGGAASLQSDGVYIGPGGKIAFDNGGNTSALMTADDGKVKCAALEVVQP